MMREIDWSLFESQEKEIETINAELRELRRIKYPQYRDSYYKYYNEFGMPGMIGDLYRKFDRLKNMSREFSHEDIMSQERKITDQLYDIISYCQLQLYWLRNEMWSKKTRTAEGPLEHKHSFSGTASSNLDYDFTTSDSDNRHLIRSGSATQDCNCDCHKTHSPL